MAEREWIMILDVDNLLTPNYLEKTIGRGDIVTTYHQFFGDSNQIFQQGTPTIENFQRGNQVDANALFRKSVWDTVGGYDEQMKEGWEDYDFWYRCLKAGYEFTIIPEPLLLYRKHGETMSVTAGRKSQELINYILNK